MKVIQIASIRIEVNENGSGSIESELMLPDPEQHSDPVAAEVYNAAVDGMLSLLLALASAGVDVDDPKFHRAILTATESLLNRYEP